MNTHVQNRFVLCMLSNWVAQFKMDINKLEHDYRVIKLVKGLESTLYEDLGTFRLEKRLREDTRAIFEYFNRCNMEHGSTFHFLLFWEPKPVDSKGGVTKYWEEFSDSKNRLIVEQICRT